MSKEKKKTQLPPDQELFCMLYASDEEFFGNGTQAYIKAYNIDATNKGSYNSARASASTLLTKTNILTRINEILEMGVLNDVFVDKELQFLIKQRSELSTKLGAIKEYNALKTRIQNKLDVNLHAPLANIKFVFSEDEGEEEEEEDNDQSETEGSTPDTN